MAQPIIGLTRDQVVAAAGIPQFRVGTVGGYTDDSKGYQEFVYGKASGAITGAGYLCTETTGFVFTLATVTTTTPGTAGFGTRVGAAQAAITDTGFGWFQIYGKGSLRTAASCAKGTRLNTTATAGVADDDATAGSEAIVGLVLGTATGGAEATNADAMFTYPSVATTL